MIGDVSTSTFLHIPLAGSLRLSLPPKSIDLAWVTIDAIDHLNLTLGLKQGMCHGPPKKCLKIVTFK